MLFIYLVAYIIGIIWGLNSSLMLGLVLFLFSLIICYLINKRIFLKFSIIAIIFILGMLYSYIKVSKMSLPYKSGDLLYDKGEIIKILDFGENYNKYIFKNLRNEKFILYVENKIDINENDLIEINKVKFNKPLSKRNSKELGYNLYLYSQNIYGTIYINSEDSFIKIGHNTNLINKIKRFIYNEFKSNFNDAEYSILIGMIEGNKIFINDKIKDDFKKSGISHVLAVSRSSSFCYYNSLYIYFRKVIRKKNFINYFNIYNYFFLCYFRF